MVSGHSSRPGTPRRGRTQSLSSNSKPKVNNGSSETRMKVVVRCRPLSEKELLGNQRTVIKIIDDQIIFDPKEETQDFFYQGVRQNPRDIGKRSNKNLPFEFDKVFDYDTKNNDIYESCISELLESVVNGFNCSVFAYGATGAGKTHTMLGNETHPGISYLTMVGLFNKMSELADTRTFDLAITYVEVYNENVHDLLKPSGQLHLREESRGGVIVSGVSVHVIKSAEELFSMLEMGNRNRTQHPTDANAQSSRSHAVFQIHMRMTIAASGVVKRMKLSMIDLAGSERASATVGCKSQQGARSKEGANINKSLLALGNCINSLADGNSHIPYRDSKLTRLLKDSLGGNCKTVMIANISPSDICYEDTYNTLKYANRAKNIKSSTSANIVQQRKDLNFYVDRVKSLEKDNEMLRKKLAMLESNVSTQPKPSQGRVAMQLLPKVSQSTVRSNFHHKIMEEFSKKMTDVRIAQNKVLSVQSLKKVLEFRRKLKNDVNNRLGEINSEFCDSEETNSRVMASINQFQGQISALETRCVDCLSEYQESYGALQALIKGNKTIKGDSRLYDFLQLELLKLNNNAIMSQVEHGSKILLLNKNEVANITQILVKSIQMLFRYHKYMKGHNLCNTQMDEEFKTIIRQLEQGFKTVSWEDDQVPLDYELLELYNLSLVPVVQLSARLEDLPVNTTITINQEDDVCPERLEGLYELNWNCGSKLTNASNLCSVYDQLLAIVSSSPGNDVQTLSEKNKASSEQAFVVANNKLADKPVKGIIEFQNKNRIVKNNNKIFKSPKVPIMKKENKENLIAKKVTKPLGTMGTSSRFPAITRPILKKSRTPVVRIPLEMDF